MILGHRQMEILESSGLDRAWPAFANEKSSQSTSPFFSQFFNYFLITFFVNNSLQFVIYSFYNLVFYRLFITS